MIPVFTNYLFCSHNSCLLFYAKRLVLAKLCGQDQRRFVVLRRAMVDPKASCRTSCWELVTSINTSTRQLLVLTKDVFRLDLSPASGHLSYKLGNKLIM